MKLSNEFNLFHRLSMRLHDGKGPPRASSRLDDGLSTDKQSFPNLEESDNRQFIKFLKYGIRGDHNEWSIPRNLGDIKTFNQKLNCSLGIATDFSSNLVANLPEDLNQWPFKDRLPEERKYVIYNRNLNALKKPLFGVVTAFPDDPNPLFSSHSNSQESLASS